MTIYDYKETISFCCHANFPLQLGWASLGPGLPWASLGFPGALPMDVHSGGS